MYAVISRDKVHLPPGTVVRMPGSWQDYQSKPYNRRLNWAAGWRFEN
jgi:hypothetical protein